MRYVIIMKKCRKLLLDFLQKIAGLGSAQRTRRTPRPLTDLLDEGFEGFLGFGFVCGVE